MPATTTRRPPAPPTTPARRATATPAPDGRAAWPLILRVELHVDACGRVRLADGAVLPLDPQAATRTEPHAPRPLLLCDDGRGCALVLLLALPGWTSTGPGVAGEG